MSEQTQTPNPDEEDHILPVVGEANRTGEFKNERTNLLNFLKTLHKSLAERCQQADDILSFAVTNPFGHHGSAKVTFDKAAFALYGNSGFEASEPEGVIAEYLEEEEDPSSGDFLCKGWQVREDGSVHRIIGYDEEEREKGVFSASKTQITNDVLDVQEANQYLAQATTKIGGKVTAQEAPRIEK